MKSQMLVLKRMKAPQELQDSFQEVCSINSNLQHKLRANPTTLLEEQCRRFGFHDVLPDGWFFRPYTLGSKFKRADSAVSGRQIEAAAIEQAYRRGYSHGFAAVRILLEDGKDLTSIRMREEKIDKWRQRTIQKFGSSPGDLEKPPRKLFGGRTKLSPRVRYSVFKRDIFCCVICGRRSSTELTLEVDHIVAISKGGTDEMKNLQTLCFECNSGKSDTE
jgi:HNH endonuclease